LKLIPYIIISLLSLGLSASWAIKADQIESPEFVFDTYDSEWVDTSTLQMVNSASNIYDEIISISAEMDTLVNTARVALGAALIAGSTVEEVASSYENLISTAQSHYLRAIGAQDLYESLMNGTTGLVHDVSTYNAVMTITAQNTDFNISELNRVLDYASEAAYGMLEGFADARLNAITAAETSLVYSNILFNQPRLIPNVTDQIETGVDTNTYTTPYDRQFGDVDIANNYVYTSRVTSVFTNTATDWDGGAVTGWPDTITVHTYYGSQGQKTYQAVIPSAITNTTAYGDVVITNDVWAKGMYKPYTDAGEFSPLTANYVESYDYAPPAPTNKPLTVYYYSNGNETDTFGMSYLFCYGRGRTTPSGEYFPETVLSVPDENLGIYQGWSQPGAFVTAESNKIAGASFWVVNELVYRGLPGPAYLKAVQLDYGQTMNMFGGDLVYSNAVGPYHADAFADCKESMYLAYTYGIRTAYHNENTGEGLYDDYAGQGPFGYPVVFGPTNVWFVSGEAGDRAIIDYNNRYDIVSDSTTTLRIPSQADFFITEYYGEQLINFPTTNSVLLSLACDTSTPITVIQNTNILEHPTDFTFTETNVTFISTVSTNDFIYTKYKRKR